jgi:hypothetical protein
MAGTNYIINPVKATCIKYSDRDKGIQGLNDTCFGICAAFSGTLDTFAMDPKCTQSCTEFIEQRKREIFGVGSCDHQVPYRPVAWGQIPRFVPQLLKKGVKIEEARNICKKMCNEKVSTLASECRETCDLDANAVEEYKQPTVKQKPIVEPPPIQTVNLQKEQSKNPLLIWCIIISFLIVVILIYKNI